MGIYVESGIFYGVKVDLSRYEQFKAVLDSDLPIEEHLENVFYEQLSKLCPTIISSHNSSTSATPTTERAILKVMREENETPDYVISNAFVGFQIHNILDIKVQPGWGNTYFHDISSESIRQLEKLAHDKYYSYLDTIVKKIFPEMQEMLPKLILINDVF
jgi:hypothetical protein